MRKFNQILITNFKLGKMRLLLKYSQHPTRKRPKTIFIGVKCSRIVLLSHFLQTLYLSTGFFFTFAAMKFNFEKYTSSKIDDLGVGYDYESVMHYNAKAFSKDGRALTISIRAGKGQKGVKLGQRYRLSDKDKKQAQLLYCNSKSSS